MPSVFAERRPLVLGRGKFGSMNSNYVDKSHLPSRHVTEGPERAPHRSYLYAMGLTSEQIHQPLVGVATAWNEAAPCNISLQRQAQAVKKGVAAARGTPREFTTITVTDGNCHGACRHEVVAGEPRRDRGFGRVDDARPQLRCAGGDGRLRQVAAGHDDGDDPAQRAVDLHLWRHHPAGSLPRPRCCCAGPVRGCWPPLSRQDG